MAKDDIESRIKKETGARLIGNFQSGSDEWLAARASGIGGSEVAAICGLSKWTSPYTLWCQKTGKISSSIQPNDAMEWGTRLEPVIIDKFEDTHPEFKVHRDIGTWMHKDRDFQVANPDGVLEDENGKLSILEIKTAMYEDDWRDGVPRYYETQIQWYMQTFGFEKAYVAVLFHGNMYAEYEVEANKFAQEVALNQVEAFIEYVRSDTEPAYDGSRSTLETIRTQHPEIRIEEVIEIDAETVTEYVIALQKQGEIESQMNFAKSKVMKIMGQSKTAKFNDEVVFVRQSRNGSTPFLIYKGAKK